jgi:5-methylcytosine-specific restriction endonuclease McrA
MDRLLEFDGKCSCGCGQKTGGANGLEWDHIIPLAMGGEDVIENLQPLTRMCHRAKTAKDRKRIAKANRMQQRAAGISRQPKRPLPGGRRSPWKMKIGGGVVRREK